METILKQKIEQCDKYLEQNPNHYKPLLSKISRYWLAASINPIEHKGYLKDAIELLEQLTQIDPASIPLQLMLVQLLVDFDQFEEASVRLKSLEKYKKYFILEYPSLGGIIAYLQILITFYGKRRFGIKNGIKQLDECIENSNEDPILLCLKGRIHCLLGEDQMEAIHLYKKAYLKGYRSPMLYQDVCAIFLKDPFLLKEISEFELQVIQWGIRYGMISREIINRLATWMIQFNQLPGLSSKAFETIYDQWNSPQILHGLCMMYMGEGRIDKDALKIYQKAWENRIYIHKLEFMYIRAALSQGDENIPLLVMQHAIFSEELEDDLKSFLYHILLNNEIRYKALLETCYDNMIAFGQSALENKKRGKYYGTIYHELLKTEQYSVDQEAELVEQLFLYEVHIDIPQIKYIWAMEREKKRIEICNVSGAIAYFHGVSDKFQVFCVGNRQQTFYHSNHAKVIKLLPHVSADILLKLYEKGYDSLELFIYLSKVYMSKKELTKQGEDIFIRCLKDEGISDYFREKVSGRLGSFFVEQGEYEKAKQYFDVLPLEDIKRNQLQSYLKAMINTGNIEKSLKVLTISEEIPLSKEEQLHLIIQAVDQGIKNSLITEMAYELFTGGYYSDTILEYLERNFMGTQNELYLLRDQLIFYGRNSNSLNERILQNGIWTHEFNNELEEVFISLYHAFQDHFLIQKFADYCAWEIVMNKKSIQRQTLHILEDLFLQKGNEYEYGLAILHVYAVQQIRTSNYKSIMEKVTSWMKRRQFLFPWMKFLEDKYEFSSYIDKNISFIRHLKSGCKVYFWYRLGSQGKYNKKEMGYMGFGLYGSILPLFYDEKVEYYIQEINQNGEENFSSIEEYHNTTMKLEENPMNDYDFLNNAVIYGYLHEYEQLEQIIEQRTSRQDTTELAGYLL